MPPYRRPGRRDILLVLTIGVNVEDDKTEQDRRKDFAEGNADKDSEAPGKVSEDTHQREDVSSL